jgi:hypothetical protein
MADQNGNPVPALPAPAPPPPGARIAEPALAPLRKVPVKLDPKKAFEGTSAVDRMKAYLKEIPTLRARLVKVIDDQEDNLKRAKASVDAFDQTTARISEIVKSWEEQNAGHPAPAVPGHVPAAAPVPETALAGGGSAPAAPGGV